MNNIGIMQGRLTPSKGRGIQFFPFDNWKNEFYIAAELGLQEIEFIFDYCDYESNPLWTEKGTKTIRRIISDTGVRVNSVCFDYFMRRPFYKYLDTTRKGIREENTCMLLRVLEAINEIGGNLIEIPLVDDSSLKSYEEKASYKEFIEYILWQTEERFQHINVGFETDFIVTDFVELIDSFDNSRIGANYDSGNSSGLGYNLYEEVTELGGRILNIHIKDRIYRGSTVALGAGSADFDNLFKALKETAYSGSFIIQAARGDDGDEVNTIKKQKAFIENYIKKYSIGI